MTQPVATDGPSPLDILLAAMQRKWNEGDADGATALARIAAPYLHPRRAASAGNSRELRSLSDAELAKRLAGSEAGEPAAQAHPGEPG